MLILRTSSVYQINCSFFISQYIRHELKKKRTRTHQQYHQFNRSQRWRNIQKGRKKKSKGSFLLRPFLSIWSILHLPSVTSSATHSPTHLPSSSHLSPPVLSIDPPPPRSQGTTRLRGRVVGSILLPDASSNKMDAERRGDY